MKPAILGALIAASLLMLAGCGGKSTSAPSGLTNRVLISNSLSAGSYASGTVQIVDGAKDLLSGSTITAGSAPGLMVVSPARDRVLVFDSASNDVSILVTSSESDAAFVTLPTYTESIIAKDTNTGFAALPTMAVSVPGVANPPLGAVAVMDLINAAVDVNTIYLNGYQGGGGKSTTLGYIPVPGARRLVMNSQGTSLLAFSDTSPCSDGSSAVTVIDVTKVAVTSSSSGTGYIQNPLLQVCGFDHAYTGVFNSDGNAAYILSCGAECGGTAASVKVLDLSAVYATVSTSNTNITQFSSITAASLPTVPAPAATVGLLNGNTLFVAGSPGGSSGPGMGSFVSLTVNGTNLPQPGSITNIGDGLHTRMVMGSNNKVFVGAVNCTNNDPQASIPTGCLTILDVSAKTKMIESAKGYVTGMVPIANRNVVYVIEGAKLHIYDTTTSAESNTIPPINIVGTLVDVKAIDQAQ